MSEHLPALESAISCAGYWRWWTAILPAAFQVEFGGVQLWNPPSGEGQPPSSLVALQFRNPRLVYFLTFADDVTADWPDQLQRDELEPPTVDHEAFTLTAPDLCGQLVGKALAVRALVGEPGVTPLPSAREVFLGFEAGPFGLVVAAESLGVFNHHGELDAQAVLAGLRRWWEYWQEYWRRKDTPNPMPQDYVCEVNIPATLLGDVLAKMPRDEACEVMTPPAPDAEPGAAAELCRSAAESTRTVERRIAGTDLIASLPSVLEDIAERGATYLVSLGPADQAGLVISGLVSPAGEVVFALGRPDDLGRVFELIDDPEYGWPQIVQVDEVRSVEDVAPGYRSHPYLCRGQECVAMSVSWWEYELVRGSGKPDA